MKITKRDLQTYLLEEDGFTITALNTGRGWAVIGDTPAMLMGKFISIDSVKQAFERYLIVLKDKRALSENPLVASPEIDGKGTILDPNLKFGPPPSRRVTPPVALDLDTLLPLPKRTS